MTVSVGATTLEREEESRMRRVGGSDNEIERKREREEITKFSISSCYF